MTHHPCDCGVDPAICADYDCRMAKGVLRSARGDTQPHNELARLRAEVADLTHALDASQQRCRWAEARAEKAEAERDAAIANTTKPYVSPPGEFDLAELSGAIDINGKPFVPFSELVDAWVCKKTSIARAQVLVAAAYAYVAQVVKAQMMIPSASPLMPEMPPSGAHQADLPTAEVDQAAPTEATRVQPLRVAMITRNLEDDEDLPMGPYVILRGDKKAVGAAGSLLGADVMICPILPAVPAEGGENG